MFFRNTSVQFAEEDRHLIRDFRGCHTGAFPKDSIGDFCLSYSPIIHLFEIHLCVVKGYGTKIAGKFISFVLLTENNISQQKPSANPAITVHHMHNTRCSILTHLFTHSALAEWLTRPTAV